MTKRPTSVKIIAAIACATARSKSTLSNREIKGIEIFQNVGSSLGDYVRCRYLLPLKVGNTEHGE